MLHNLVISLLSEFHSQAWHEFWRDTLHFLGSTTPQSTTPREYRYSLSLLSSDSLWFLCDWSSPWFAVSWLLLVYLPECTRSLAPVHSDKLHCSLSCRVFPEWASSSTRLLQQPEGSVWSTQRGSMSWLLWVVLLTASISRGRLKNKLFMLQHTSHKYLKSQRYP